MTAPTPAHYYETIHFESSIANYHFILGDMFSECGAFLSILVASGVTVEERCRSTWIRSSTLETLLKLS